MYLIETPRVVSVGMLTLMSCHMILVISSPSSSTTGFLTLILGIFGEAMLRRCCTLAATGRGKDRAVDASGDV